MPVVYKQKKVFVKDKVRMVVSSLFRTLRLEMGGHIKELEKVFKDLDMFEEGFL